MYLPLLPISKFRCIWSGPNGLIRAQVPTNWEATGPPESSDHKSAITTIATTAATPPAIQMRWRGSIAMSLLRHPDNPVARSETGAAGRGSGADGVGAGAGCEGGFAGAAGSVPG